jgi:Fur family transcriptional regulator, ferric uptake regulator
MSARPVAGRRRTPKRQAVLEQLGKTDRFRTAQQLHSDIRQHHSVRMGLTTVYRILRNLADENIAEAQRGEDGETLYRLRATPAHRHYLVCRQCGRAVGFTAHDIEHLCTRLADEHGYRDITHHVDLYGTCPLCPATSTRDSADCAAP